MQITNEDNAGISLIWILVRSTFQTENVQYKAKSNAHNNKNRVESIILK